MIVKGLNESDQVFILNFHASLVALITTAKNMLLHCLLWKQISVAANLDVVLILVTFLDVIYLDVLEMAAKLTRLSRRR